MRRLNRKLLLSLLCAVTFLLTAAWLIGHWHPLSWSYTTGRGQTSFFCSSDYGVFGVSFQHNGMGLIGPDDATGWHWEWHYADFGFSFCLLLWGPLVLFPFWMTIAWVLLKHLRRKLRDTNGGRIWLVCWGLFGGCLAAAILFIVALLVCPAAIEPLLLPSYRLPALYAVRAAILAGGLAVGVFETIRARKACLRRVGVPLCANCGYNLTGNVSGVCPECGERI